MSYLHLHVISQDFNSAAFKTKKRWNSFTTKYFVDSSRIIEQLEKFDKIDLIPAAEARSFIS
uniref:Aprataxin C2HE/C2H2/C2HC zinc finger domain-containing protein n=1 Tax=Strigamia maritima TaxID=126957 RepID=T1JD96_STRMM